MLAIRVITRIQNHFFYINVSLEEKSAKKLEANVLVTILSIRNGFKRFLKIQLLKGLNQLKAMSSDTPGGGGGGGGLTPKFGRYVPRQSEKWGAPE